MVVVEESGGGGGAGEDMKIATKEGAESILRRPCCNLGTVHFIKIVCPLSCVLSRQNRR